MLDSNPTIRNLIIGPCGVGVPLLAKTIWRWEGAYSGTVTMDPIWSPNCFCIEKPARASNGPTGIRPPISLTVSPGRGDGRLMTARSLPGRNCPFTNTLPLA